MTVYVLISIYRGVIDELTGYLNEEEAKEDADALRQQHGEHNPDYDVSIYPVL